MEYLPVILKKGRPLLAAVSREGCSHRAVCPRSKLVAFVDGEAHVRASLLTDDKRELCISSENFTGCQWVVPGRSELDCVVDEARQRRSELLAVTMNFDLHWYSISESPGEEGGGASDGVSPEGLTLERLATLKRSEFSTALRKLDHSYVLESVVLLGSDSSQVLLLLNSALLCKVELDREFGRVVLVSCMAVDTSLEPFEDDSLPALAGEVVSLAFSSPLLFALTEHGVVFIYNASTAVCVGVVNATEYCKYACGRQPDAGELLALLNGASFTHLSVSADLNKLVVSTQCNHLVLVNLPEFFQVFPAHYHPKFVNTHMRRQRSATKASSKLSNIAAEEDEDRRRYGGIREKHFTDPFRGNYTGQYALTSRIDRLSHELRSFHPRDGRDVKFNGTSKLSSPKKPQHISTRVESDLQGSSSLAAWFEEPVSHSPASDLASPNGTDKPFLSGMHRSVADRYHQSSSEPLSPSRLYYQHRCILPPASSLLQQQQQQQQQGSAVVVHMEFDSGAVVAYYGEEARSAAIATLAEQDMLVPATGLAVYLTESQSYSASRLSQPCWLVRSTNHDQPLYLVSEHVLAVATYNISQEEFVSKVLMYGSASVAEELCQLNRWDKCSLPINALESALELRQLDTLAFFLKSRDTDSPPPTGEEDDDADHTHLPHPSEVPSLPPLPPEQLDTAVRLLISAIQRNYQEEHYCQFASQLLLMALGFLTRIIRSQVLLEGQTEPHPATPLDDQADEFHLTSLSPLNYATSSAGDHEREGGPSSSSSSTNDPGISVSLSELTSFVQQLRVFLPKSSSQEEEPTSLAGLDRVGKEEEEEEQEEGEGVGESHRAIKQSDFSAYYLDQSVCKAWDKMNHKEVLKDAILRGSLPLAQAYLTQRNPSTSRHSEMGGSGRGLGGSGRGLGLAEGVDDYSDSHGGRYDASLASVLRTAVGFVLEALEQRRLEQATSLLTQLGLDVTGSLKHITFHTLNRQLRDFLAKELSIQKCFSEAELQALHYLHLLEGFYSSQSYEEAQSWHARQHPRKMVFQATALPVMPRIISRPTPIPTLGNLHEIYPETFGGDYVLTWEATPTLQQAPPTHCLYLQAPLFAVLAWDTPTRQRLLFEAFLLSGQAEGTECEKAVQKEYVFDYHVSHCDLTRALQFVTSRVPPLGNHTPCPAYLLELCSSLPHCTIHLSNTLLDELARHGVLLERELASMPALLHRLGRVYSLFTHPHPLSKTSLDPEEGESSVISLEAFHRGFLRYLVENRFFSLMHHYLDCYSLGLDDDSISKLGLAECEYPWVDVLLQYRRASLNSRDPSVMFQASLSCGRLLLSSKGEARSAITLTDMLESGKALMAVATLMFAPVTLDKAMDVEDKGSPWYVDPSLMRQAVAAYPSLQAAVFPPPPTTLTPAQSQDITVYQLLQGSVHFNISRLFKWQSTNRLASAHEDAIESMHEIPNFSSTVLTDKYALTAHLTYLHYLRRGQPSFAFANFVAARLLGHSNTARRIDRAVARVYRLAMQELGNTKLAASCAAFVEMLDRDSTLLRVDTQAALRIARHGQGDDNGRDSNDKHKKIASQFVQLHHSLDNSAMATALLVQLEAATSSLVSSSGVETCGLEAEECWSLVQVFCHCHQLPPSLVFPTVCAREAHWLPLLCHAQLYSIPPQKVLSIVDKHFSAACVKEHLQLAISAMGVRDHLPSSPSSPLTPHSARGPGGGGGGGGGGGEKPFKAKRKRAGSGSRGARPREAESLVSTQPDLRAKFYSRVGLQRENTPQPAESKPAPPPAHSEEPGGSQRTRASTTSSDVFQTSPELDLKSPALEESDLPPDLFSVLFKCQTHGSPWRALLAHSIALQRPLLAILAACDEQASAVDCICVWLCATLGWEVMHRAYLLLGVETEGSHTAEQSTRFTAELQWRRWSVHDLSLLLVAAMQHTPSQAAHFSLAFQYFDQNNPLLPFLRFYEEFTLRRDFIECQTHLQQFALTVDKTKMYGFGGLVGDLNWVELQSSTTAAHMLAKCPTPFERSHLLQLLSEASFGKEFKCNVLNFSDLHQMSVVLSEAGLASDAAFTIKETFSSSPGPKSLSEVFSVRVRVDSDYVLGLLLERGLFAIARRYAAIVGSTASQVTIKEAEHNLRKISQSSYWKYEQARLHFWHQCNSTFHAARVDPESAAEFYESTVHGSSEEPLESGSDWGGGGSGGRCSATERALLLAFALKWRKETDVISAEQLREFEREIWLSHLHAAMEDGQDTGVKSGSSPLPFLPECHTGALFPPYPAETSLLSSLSISAQEEYKGRRQLGEFLLPDNVSITLDRKSLSVQEGEVFDKLLGRLMNAGLLSQARELATLFEHDSAELTIVLCCIQLAQGKLTPDQLTEGVLSLVSARPPRHLSDPALSFDEHGGAGGDGGSLTGGGGGRTSAEIVRMMHKLSDRAFYAQQCCSCVITCFRIALSLKMSYASVITSEPFDTLTRLLSSRLTDRTSLAMKFVATCNLEARDVAVYLCDCMGASLHGYHSGAPSESAKSRVYYALTSSHQFMELAQLCPDVTLFGSHLLTRAKTLGASEERTPQSIAIQVELLIRAHDCFTVGCYVDGIAEVLHVAQQWVNTLVDAHSFKTMVRLLTGLARYHELSHIIGLLLQYDQFELLVHTGVEKEEQLRIALMDYLRKNHPDDHEKMQMVALKFAMFRELAKTREEQAKRDLRRIKPKHLGPNHPETIKTLKQVFEGFRAAAKTYSKEDCLASAEYCYAQARLVALQLNVLQQGKHVINLQPKQVHRFMEEQNFAEGLIVADAYKRTIWADWVVPLYKKVVIGGDFRYLADYKSAYPLTPTIFQELASKYFHDREKTPEAATNMKKLLSHLKNLPLKRKLSLDLGLKEVHKAISFDEGFLNDVARL